MKYKNKTNTLCIPIKKIGTDKPYLILWNNAKKKNLLKKKEKNILYTISLLKNYVHESYNVTRMRKLEKKYPWKTTPIINTLHK